MITRERSVMKAFEGIDIFKLTDEINDFTHRNSLGQHYIVIEEQTIKIIGTKYIILIRYHLEKNDRK